MPVPLHDVLCRLRLHDPFHSPLDPRDPLELPIRRRLLHANVEGLDVEGVGAPQASLGGIRVRGLEKLETTRARGGCVPL